MFFAGRPDPGSRIFKEVVEVLVDTHPPAVDQNRLREVLETPSLRQANVLSVNYCMMNGTMHDPIWRQVRLE